MTRHLPRYRPGLPLLRRGRGAVQVGLDPRRGVLVDRLSDDAASALLRLDGTTLRHDLVRAAPDLDHVLDELERRGLLDDDPGAAGGLSAVRRARHAAELGALAVELGGASDAVAVLARRSRAVVEVRGNDPVATQVAVGLAAAGVGVVPVDGPDHEVGADDLTPVGPHEPSTSWRADIAEAVRAQGAHPTASASRARRPALVVVCAAADADVPWTDPELADDLLADGQSHLAVAVTGSSARVGPLVLPGRSACLWCLDRHATDRDGAWPALADQLRLRHPRATTRSSALTTLAAALAVAQALDVVDAVGPEPVTVGAQVELRVREPLPVVLPCAPHPLCGCGWGADTSTMAG